MILFPMILSRGHGPTPPPPQVHGREAPACRWWDSPHVGSYEERDSSDTLAEDSFPARGLPGAEFQLDLWGGSLMLKTD